MERVRRDRSAARRRARPAAAVADGPHREVHAQLSRRDVQPSVRGVHVPLAGASGTPAAAAPTSRTMRPTSCRTARASSACSRSAHRGPVDRGRAPHAARYVAGAAARLVLGDLGVRRDAGRRRRRSAVGSARGAGPAARRRRVRGRRGDAAPAFNEIRPPVGSRSVFVVAWRPGRRRSRILDAVPQQRHAALGASQPAAGGGSPCVAHAGTDGRRLRRSSEAERAWVAANPAFRRTKAGKWRNGIRSRLKSDRVRAHVGSSPTFPNDRRL